MGLREDALASGLEPGDFIKGYRIKSIDAAAGAVEFHDAQSTESYRAELDKLIADPITPGADVWGSWPFPTGVTAALAQSWRGLKTWEMTFDTGRGFDPIRATLPDRRGQVYTYVFMIEPKFPWALRGRNIAAPDYPACDVQFAFSAIGTPKTADDWADADTINIGFALRNRTLDVKTFVSNDRSAALWVTPKKPDMMPLLKRFRIMPFDQSRFLIAVDIERPLTAAWAGMRFTPDLGTWDAEYGFTTSTFATHTGAATVSELCNAWVSGVEPPVGILATLDPTSILPVSASGIATYVKAQLDAMNDATTAVDDDLRADIRQMQGALSILQTFFVAWSAALMASQTSIKVYDKLADLPSDQPFAFLRIATGQVSIFRRDDDGVWSALSAIFGTDEERTARFTAAMAWLKGQFTGAGGSLPPDFDAAISALGKRIDAQAATVKDIETALTSVKGNVDAAIMAQQLGDADLETKIDATRDAVKEIASFSIPALYWPADYTPALAKGSLMVRRGDTATVAMTSVLNVGPSGSHQFTASFGSEHRGKAVVLRSALRATDTASTISLSVQTTAGGTLLDASLAYVNGAWTATGGTVTVDAGFAVLSAPFTFSSSDNANMWVWLTPGMVQLPCLYLAGAATYTKTVTGLTVTDTRTGASAVLPVGLAKTLEDQDASVKAIDPRLTAIEGKFNSLTTVTALGGMTRANGLPFITAPDRAGARADLLAFTFRDNRVSTSGKMDYPARVTAVSMPIAAFLAGGAVPAGWAATTRTINGETLSALYRRYNLKDTPNGANAFYDLWVSWRRANDGLDLWFESLHSASVNLGETRDISITYVADSSVVDPKLKPLGDRITALEAKPDPDVSGLATTVQLSAETTRAKKAEGDNALDIATLSSSIGVVSSSLAAEVARAKAAEALLTSPDLSAYAKLTNLAVKRGRTKLWSPALGDLAITLGSAIVDASGSLPPSADIDAPVFTVVPAAAGSRAARVRFTIPNLVVGQEYELVAEVGIGITTGFTFGTAGAATVDGPDWRRHTLTIKPISTSYSGYYEVMWGATVHGPALYAMPGLYVRDKDLVDIRVAEPGDIEAAKTLLNTNLNMLNTSRITPLIDRVTALEGTASPDLAAYQEKMVPASGWFDTTGEFGYVRQTVPPINTISFEYSDPDDINVIGTMNITDFTGWAAAGFDTDNDALPDVSKFHAIIMASGRSINLGVARQGDGGMHIRVMRPNGLGTRGKVRKVLVNGKAVDTVPLTDEIARTNAEVARVDAKPLASYRTEAILDSSASLTSEKYVQITGVPAGTYLATFRLTLNLTTTGSRLWACGVSVNDAAVVHPTNTHAAVAITADTYTVNYPHVAAGSAIVTLPNATNTVEVKGQLYGTDALTGETVQHGHLTLIKL